MIAAPPKPTQRRTDAAVALVNSAPAGALVGLLGFRLAVVMSEVLHATAPVMSASPVRPRIQVLFIDSSSVCGGGLWGDLQGDADAARRRHGCEFQSLRVSGAVRELGIDIRDVGMRPQIATHKCHIDCLCCLLYTSD